MGKIKPHLIIPAFLYTMPYRKEKKPSRIIFKTLLLFARRKSHACIAYSSERISSTISPPYTYGAHTLTKATVMRENNNHNPTGETFGFGSLNLAIFASGFTRMTDAVCWNGSPFLSYLHKTWGISMPIALEALAAGSFETYSHHLTYLSTPSLFLHCTAHWFIFETVKVRRRKERSCWSPFCDAPSRF